MVSLQSRCSKVDGFAGVFPVNDFAVDTDSSARCMITEPDVCSEGLSSLKFSFGLTPYFKKEESNNTDKGDIAQMAERLDKTVSLEHQLQSNDASESPCSTMETAGVKYVRGGKTKSLVEEVGKERGS
ncbi:hypothetical protein GUJ93_ZPchr0011g26994 [Zizania palustris]|uniref:Uncharacterized protein n=1 Tax=Zizania palustris TaxID=103762 RepID=A0A8J5WIZ1_ZIZPA|nr:hypothetical protein GUJ93_ZPchr0011g26994 [Zizania palustris]